MIYVSKFSKLLYSNVIIPECDVILTVNNLGLSFHLFNTFDADFSIISNHCDEHYSKWLPEFLDCNL